eukprot:COSAG02_NODE_555_length_20407_cov_11.072878_3_plen_98_part_00
MSVWARNLKDPTQKGATALLFLNANTTACDSKVDKSCGGALTAAHPSLCALSRGLLTFQRYGERSVISLALIVRLVDSMQRCLPRGCENCAWKLRGS